MKYKEELDWLNENNYGLTTYEEDFELRLNTELHMLDEKYKRREDKIRNQGINIGLDKGINIGRNENSIDIAKNMLNEGINIGVISKCTNLPESKIMSL